MVAAVNRLALTTGKNPMPDYKVKMGFRYEPQKFETAGLTALPSDRVQPPRAAECPVQLESIVERMHPFSDLNERAVAIEVRIVRIHIDERLLSAEKRHHIDADKWRPLIMSFCEFYGLGEQLDPSRLAQVF
jgi:flavin reductase (DIM6/NTAB) family NADH-FMN oxidoreductase RutF